MMCRPWQVRPLDREKAAELSEMLNIPSFLGMMLAVRGVTDPAEAMSVLGMEDGFPFDPFLLRDMETAALRVQQAIEDGECIAVFGDYDADGVTATALLTKYLRSKGAHVLPYIPQREGEGYGMNENAVRTLHEKGARLLITVDNGIAGEKEVRLARDLTMDVIVTDHHRVQGTLPPALAVVDPQREDEESPYRDFAGVGLAYELCCAVESAWSDPEETLSFLLDLAAVGTVGDVVPLTGENRRLVKKGIRRLRDEPCQGLRALLKAAGAGEKAVSARDLAFTVVPRLNAVGRMGSPKQALRLLLCEDREEANEIAQSVNTENDRRRSVEADVLKQAMEKLQTEPERLLDQVLVVEGENWHPGVIGIVAARLTETFGKPSVVITLEGDKARGSGRSVEGFSLFEAVKACAPVLTRFGGHPMAAGLSVEPDKIPAFRKAINEYAKEQHPFMPVPTLTLDCRLRPAAVTEELSALLEELEPFGAGFPAPLFGLYGMTVRGIVPVGGGGHLRLLLEKDGVTLSCMRFGMTKEALGFREGDVVDAAVSLSRHEFRGQMSLTTQIMDLRPAGLDTEELVREKQRYEALCRGEIPEGGLSIRRPGRDDFAALYRLLRDEGGWHSSQEALWQALCRGASDSETAENQPVPFLTLLLMCDVLRERGLIDYQYPMGHITLCSVKGKVDLMASPVLHRLG